MRLQKRLVFQCESKKGVITAQFKLICNICSVILDGFWTDTKINGYFFAGFIACNKLKDTQLCWSEIGKFRRLLKCILLFLRPPKEKSGNGRRDIILPLCHCLNTVDHLADSVFFKNIADDTQVHCFVEQLFIGIHR